MPCAETVQVICGMANVRELHCFYVAEIVLSFCLFLTLYMYMYLHGRLSASVNRACCSSASPCVDGLPAHCTSSCAAVLLPMKASCDAFLRKMFPCSRASPRNLALLQVNAAH